MENYRTRGEIFTTVMFDIDFLKSVNDTYGHPYGDKVLITISGGLYENDTFIKGECIKNADKLLYKAKENGRNRIEV